MATIKVEFDLKQIAETDTVPIAGIRDWTEFSDGKRGKRLGSCYEILLLNNACSKLTVKVEDSASAFTQEELDKRNMSMNFVMAKFEGFKAKPYVDRNGQLQLSAKAEKIILLSSNSGAGVSKA